MTEKKTSSGRVLDITDPNILKFVGYTESQLIGPIGALTLNEIKLNAKKLSYDFLAYREPLRPGKLVAENLKTNKKSIWKELETTALIEKLCPGLLAAWSETDLNPLDWDMIYPPVSTPAIQYANVLEWLCEKFPEAVVPWVELSITYESDMNLHYSLESIQKQCFERSKNYNIVAHVLGFPEYISRSIESRL